MIGVEASIYRSGWGALRQIQVQGFCNLLNRCLCIWRKDEDERKGKEAEEDNLYIFKAKANRIPLYEYESLEIEAEVFPLYKLTDVAERQDNHTSLHTEHLESLSLNDLYKLHLSLFDSESQERILEYQPPLDAYHVASYLVHCLQTLPGKNVFVSSAFISVVA